MQERLLPAGRLRETLNKRLLKGDKVKMLGFSHFFSLKTQKFIVGGRMLFVFVLVIEFMEAAEPGEQRAYEFQSMNSQCEFADS